MVATFGDRRTERFANGQRVQAFSGIERTAERRLRELLAARSLNDLGGVPGLRLERLKGDRNGQWSIRINDQWRICFVWDASLSRACAIEIADYN